MPWKTIKRRAYYYRNRRVGGRVVSEYVGTGEVAELVARLDAAERAERDQARAGERADRERDGEVEGMLDDLVARARGEAARMLEAAGYRQHKRGEWRRRREHRHGH
jgi:hypothetical protein